MDRRVVVLLGSALLVGASALAADGKPFTAGGTPAPSATTLQGATPLQLQFDGRATRVDALWSLSSGDQGVTPRIWDGLLFENNDITVVPDDVYGKVYSVRAGPGSTNPFYNVGPDRASAELTTIRRNRLGNWDWYGIAVRLEPGFVAPPDWCVLAQFDYPSLSSPPASLDVRKIDGTLTWTLSRNAGLLTENSGGFYVGTAFEEPALMPAEVGKWTEFVIGIYWKTDASGQIRVYSRVRADGQKSFTLRLLRRRTPTWQYGSTPYGNVARNGTDVASGAQHGTLDKQGLYFGWTGGGFPTDRVSETGLIRSPSLAAVLAGMR